MRISDWSSDVCSSDLISCSQPGSRTAIRRSGMAATVSTRLWIGVKCCATNKVRTRPVTWIYVDGRGRDLQTLVTDIQAVIAREVKLPPGVSVSYTGQFEFLVRATERMKIVVPMTLAIIFGLLYLTFRRRSEEH